MDGVPTADSSAWQGLRILERGPETFKLEEGGEDNPRAQRRKATANAGRHNNSGLELGRRLLVVVPPLSAGPAAAEADEGSEAAGSDPAASDEASAADDLAVTVRSSFEATGYAGPARGGDGADTKAWKVFDHSVTQKEALRRLADAATLVNSYKSQLELQGKELEELRKQLSNGAVASNAGTGKLAPSYRFEGATVEGTTEGTQDFSATKIVNWLRNDARSRAAVDSIRSSLMDQYTTEGQLSIGVVSDHLWRCGMNFAVRWGAGESLAVRELEKQNDTLENRLRQLKREALKESSMLRQHVKRLEKAFKQVQMQMEQMRRNGSGPASPVSVGSYQPWAAPAGNVPRAATLQPPANNPRGARGGAVSSSAATGPATRGGAVSGVAATTGPAARIGAATGLAARGGAVSSATTPSPAAGSNHRASDGAGLASASRSTGADQGTTMPGSASCRAGGTSTQGRGSAANAGAGPADSGAGGNPSGGPGAENSGKGNDPGGVDAGQPRGGTGAASGRGNAPRSSVAGSHTAGFGLEGYGLPAGAMDQPSLVEDDTIEYPIDPEALRKLDNEIFEPLDGFDEDMRELMIDCVDAKVRRILQMSPEAIARLPYGMRPNPTGGGVDSEMEAELQRMKEEMDALKRERDYLRNQFEAAKREAELERERKAALEARIRELEAELARLREEQSKERKEKDALMEKNAKMEEAVARKEGRTLQPADREKDDKEKEKEKENDKDRDRNSTGGGRSNSSSAKDLARIKELEAEVARLQEELKALHNIRDKDAKEALRNSKNSKDVKVVETKVVEKQGADAHGIGGRQRPAGMRPQKDQSVQADLGGASSQAVAARSGGGFPPPLEESSNNKVARRSQEILYHVLQKVRVVMALRPNKAQKDVEHLYDTQTPVASALAEDGDAVEDGIPALEARDNHAEEKAVPAFEKWASSSIKELNDVIGNQDPGSLAGTMKGSTVSIVDEGPDDSELRKLRKTCDEQQQEIARLLLLIDELRARLDKVPPAARAHGPAVAQGVSSVMEQAGLRDVMESGNRDLGDVFERLYEDACQRIQRLQLVRTQLDKGDAEAGLARMSATTAAALHSMWYRTDYLFRRACEFAAARRDAEGLFLMPRKQDYDEELAEERGVPMNRRKSSTGRLPGKREARAASIMSRTSEFSNGSGPAGGAGNGRLFWMPVESVAGPGQIKAKLLDPEGPSFRAYVDTLQQAQQDPAHAEATAFMAYVRALRKMEGNVGPDWQKQQAAAEQKQHENRLGTMVGWQRGSPGQEGGTLAVSRSLPALRANRGAAGEDRGALAAGPGSRFSPKPVDARLV